MSFIDHIDAFTNGISELVDRAEAERQYVQAESRSMTAQEAAELRQAAHEAWQDSYCPQHREDLPCAQCEQELLDEKRQEGFLERHESVQEANERILLNAWEIGEHLGPKSD